MDFAINGFGRIGRALFRIAFYDGRNVCVYINEPKASIDDIIYFLKYDSLYAGFQVTISKISSTTFSVENANSNWIVSVSHFSDPFEIKTDASVIIDASGEVSHLGRYNRNNRIILFTSSDTETKNEVILGFNDADLANIKEGEILFGSICDSVAVVPILGKLMERHVISQALITTMHPALAYQKVLDNYTSEGISRTLGRQYIDSIIPKRTSLEAVLKHHLNTDNTLIRCMSFRVPTESVCLADITLFFEHEITFGEVSKELQSLDPRIIGFSDEDLVSIDYKATHVSATIDTRWLEVLDNHILKMVIWYDNEWGYSSRINDLIAMLQV